MSLPTSKNAYLDCIEYLDRAMSETKGARVKVASHDIGIRLRMRMHQLRSILRRDSTLIYEPGDPGYDITAYDPLTITIENVKGQHFVVMKKNEPNMALVEALPDEPLQLTDGKDDFIDGEFTEAPAKIEQVPMKLLPIRRL